MTRTPEPQPSEVIADLRRVQVLFQARAITAHIGAPRPANINHVRCDEIEGDMA